MSEEVFTELANLPTESINSRSADLDLMTSLEIVSAMNAEDKTVAEAVEKTLPQIASAADFTAESFLAGGRLIYVGAGTSGRLGVLDASECPPTFGVPREMVVGVIAGGYDALVRSIEGAEDDENAGADAVRNLKVSRKDIVCGISASKRTPYVLAALKEAKNLGAKTIFLCCNPASREEYMDVLINPITGPELLSGSTRLKAGTATKMILNMITTTAMASTGKTYKNYMVDLNPLSEKLRARSRLILSRITGEGYDECDKLLSAAKGELKTAAAIYHYGVDYENARRIIAENGGKIRTADTKS